MPRYRSGLEEKVADLLSNLKVEFEYESTKVPYILQCNYTPDFLLPNGVYLETKGQLTEEDRRKMLAVKKMNPDLDIRFVFQPLWTTLVSRHWKTSRHYRRRTRCSFM
jgi:hypothetical protein